MEVNATVQKIEKDPAKLPNIKNIKLVFAKVGDNLIISNKENGS